MSRSSGPIGPDSTAQRKPRRQTHPLHFRDRRTSLDVGSAEWIYDSLYCARGQAKQDKTRNGHTEHVGPEDFVWGDQTRYSGGWQYQRDAREYARRIDVLRAELGKRYNYTADSGLGR
jgi:hypothetical protein